MRARNALAVELANRYLALFKGNGVTVAIPQRLDQVTAPDGKVWTLFVPIDAPKFEAQVVTNQDDADVTVFVAQGTSAVIAGKPGAATEPAPATEPKVAEPKPDVDKPEPKPVPKAAPKADVPKADVPKTGAKPAPKAAPKPAPKPVTGTKPAPVPPTEKKP